MDLFDRTLSSQMYRNITYVTRRRVAPRCSSPSTHMQAPHAHPVRPQVLFPSDRESNSDSDSDEDWWDQVPFHWATPVATPVAPPGEPL